MGDGDWFFPNLGVQTRDQHGATRKLKDVNYRHRDDGGCGACHFKGCTSKREVAEVLMKLKFVGEYNNLRKCVLRTGHDGQWR